jgi:hypothetical protein
MKHTIPHLSMGFALFLASLANQSFSQSTPQSISGPGWEARTLFSPAVAVAGVNEFAVWIQFNYNNISFSIFNGTDWTTPTLVGGSGWTAETNAAPALAVDLTSGDVWVAWKGLSDNKVWFSYWNSNGWSTQAVVSGSTWTAETDTSPAIAATQNSSAPIYLAWKGASTDKVWFTYGGSFGWAIQKSVYGDYMGSHWTAKTNVAPGLEAWYEGAAVNWSGTSKGEINYSGVDIGTDDWGADEKLYCPDPKWTAETNAQPVGSNFANSGGTSNTTAVFWHGKSDNSVWYTYFVDWACGFDSWMQQATVGESGWSASSDYAPAVASYPNYATVSILAWENAKDNTILYIDPTTLPGLTAYAP